MIKDACQSDESSRLLPGLIYEITTVGPAPQGPSPPALSNAVGAEEVEGERSDLAGFGLGPGSEPVPGYHLVSRIGRGSTGEVWKAIGPGGFPVALKFVGLGERDAEDELRSLSLMKNVRHANLLTIFGTWQLDGLLVVGMDLADGTVMDRCAEAIGRGEPGIPPKELATFMEQAARGVDFLNQPRHRILGRDAVGLLHRDIKPQNLLLVGGSVKLADFGLVASLDDPWEIHNAQSLTSAYIPPEWSQGRFARESDQYALAMTYCRLRSGRLPTSRMAGYQAVPDELDLAMLPERERPILARALARCPEDRWADCLTFANELAGAIGLDDDPNGREVVRTRAPGEVQAASAGALRGRLRLFLAVSFTAMFLAAGQWFARVDDSRTPREPARALVVSVPKEATPDARSEGVETREIVEFDDLDEPSPPTLTLTRTQAFAAISSLTEPARTKIRLAFNAFREGVGILKEKATAADAAGQPMRRHSVARPVPPEVEAPANATPPPVDPKPDREPGVILEERKAAETEAEAEAYLKKARAVEAIIKAKEREMAGASGARTSTINVFLPDANAELVVKGDVGKGNPDEWYGSRRVIHTPPLGEEKAYLVGSFWTDRDGRQQARSKELKVKPGRSYEVDLRGESPTSRQVGR